jgi:hypothetical protein
MASFEESNRLIREAVAARMAATPADDPKLDGYRPHPLAGCQPAQAAAAAVLADVWREPEVGCTACEGSPFVAKARTMEQAQRATAEAEPVVLADLPAEFLERIKGVDIKPATETAPAEFKIERIGGSMSPEQLEAAWAGIKARREEMMARIHEPVKDRLDRRRIIGIAGRAGAGKNTVAEMIPGAAVFGFADPLYEGLAAMLGVPEEMLRSRRNKETPLVWLGKSPRELMQLLGTEWGRGMVAQDIWLRLAKRRIETYGGTIVFSDVRFDNEAEWIRNQGGEVWLVERDQETHHTHSSEAGISRQLIDRVIDNRGPLEQTRMLVEMALPFPAG